MQPVPPAQNPPISLNPAGYDPQVAARRYQDNAQTTDSDIYDDTAVRPPNGSRNGQHEDYRISRSSFYDEIEQEQGATGQPPPAEPTQPTLFKAKRIGFNYMERKT